MAYTWFKKIILNTEGEPTNHPLYSGYERTNDDGSLFLVHDELLGKFEKAKTATMPSALTLASKGTEAICTKDEYQTKTLLATTAWATKEVAVKEVDAKA